MNLAEHPWALIFFWIIWAGFVWYTYDEIKTGRIRSKLFKFSRKKNPRLFKSMLIFQTAGLIAMFYVLVYFTRTFWFY